MKVYIVIRDVERESGGTGGTFIESSILSVHSTKELATNSCPVRTEYSTYSFYVEEYDVDATTP